MLYLREPPRGNGPAVENLRFMQLLEVLDIW